MGMRKCETTAGMAPSLLLVNAGSVVIHLVGTDKPEESSIATS